MPIEEIYQKTYKNIFRYFYYKNLKIDVAEDLTADVFVRMYEKYGADRDDIPEKIVYGYARNIYLEYIKTNKYMCNIDPDLEDIFADKDSSEDIESEFAEYTDFENKLEGMKKRLQQSLELLSDNVQKVIKYRFLESKTRTETALLLGISESDVHTYQKRGIKQLKNILGGIYG